VHSVGVLAHSFETKMAKESEELAKKILDNGGILVTQFPFGITPKAFSYMQKNRLQALLSEAVVLVQASLKSEALYFAKTILQEGQKLFVVPPSQKDIDNNEVNIEVNQVIVSKDSYEIKKLLFCDCKTLQNIIIMENKDDKYS
jgi:DNA processing protein